MIFEKYGFPQLPPIELNLSKLERMSTPGHRVLAGFIDQCASDECGSTMVTAALILSMWQMKGPALSEHAPSLILLNAGEAAPDPIDEAIRELTQPEDADPEASLGNLYGCTIPAEKGANYMRHAIHQRRELGPTQTLRSLDRNNALIFENRFRQGQKSAYGSSIARPYAKAWSDEFGLITTKDDMAILRLEAPEDHVSFREDVMNRKERLLSPRGIGEHLQETAKSAYVSGSLTVDLWDDKLAEKIVELGLPTVILPHMESTALGEYNKEAMDYQLGQWLHKGVSPARSGLSMPENDWFKQHMAELRRRLHQLPGDGSYEFSILQLVHQLGSVCQKISVHFCSASEATKHDAAVLYWAIYSRTLRGITLGVASMAWHGLGFDPGCPRIKAMKALRDIRRRGVMTSSDVLRCAHLKRDERDALLECFQTEGLVQVDGKNVSAVEFGDFVTSLHSRPSLPGLKDCK